MEDGPTPSTMEGYIIAIYGQLKGQNKDIKTLCDAIHDHEERIATLEKANICQESFASGKEDWWQTYKEPILIIFSLITGAIITVLLNFAGVRQ